ncbi:hypothetical protein H6801_01740 [Candidatus Nomurabacteria bacterium]|nr:hypothetical protein [Candidatus Nomurabacteria bacterium]
MAGSYPDVPGYRFAYDVDGTTVVKYGISGGAISTLSNGDMATLNHDQSNPGWWDSLSSILLFYSQSKDHLRGCF